MSQSQKRHEAIFNSSNIGSIFRVMRVLYIQFILESDCIFLMKGQAQDTQTQQVSTGGSFVPITTNPPARGQLTMSGEISDCHSWWGICYWHVASRGQGYCQTSYNTEDNFLITKNCQPQISIVPLQRNSVLSDYTETSQTLDNIN